MENIDISLIDWSRGQFALTAIYHWIFVPLTLGLSFIIAIMESIYVRTGNEEWKKITKFWMKLFGINFAIGVATGIILEFEFGTNWSNYSWFVGDIFGAPLAIEGIMAFFLETTFIAVMFLGWEKVSKKFHLASTWLVAVGANLSALWILVANAWMQYPVGMQFNPDTARCEMVNFWEVFLSPVAVNKFLHTVTSGYVIASLFVLGISSWYLIKKREIVFAKKSIVIASVFGLISSLFLAFTGDGSAYHVAQKQPAKLAAMEGLFNGKKGAGLIAFGILNPKNDWKKNDDDLLFKIELPKMLSLLGYRDFNAFVPGINDIVNGNVENNIEGTKDKILKGRIAISALADYKKAKANNNIAKADSALTVFKSNFSNFGYGYLNKPEESIPSVSILFYSFHFMAIFGFYFILLFLVTLILAMKNNIDNKRFILKLAVFSIPLGYISSQLGWILAEVGRQPWAIQDIMPTSIATTQINTSSVITTFVLFAVLFTVLLIAEIKIMITQIKQGPEMN